MSSRRRTTARFGAAFLAIVGAASAAEAAGVCADRAAKAALEMRVLQSELMVAALSCNERASYNAFVTTFKPFLQDQGARLRTFFTKAYGPSGGPYQLNKMITRLANEASQNSIAQDANAYCDAERARFAAILAADSQNLTALAGTSPTADAHGVRACVEVAEGEAAAPQPGSN